MPEGMIEEKEFTCPTCGSHHFGSYESGGVTTRMCHGYTAGKACNFSFPITDDAQYFAGTGRFHSATGGGEGAK